ncbi:MAG: hypothetical protein OXH68_05720 [Gammaproteobacteria bacterium]|nr:hypothetical protein [Gammaproteobacteria bacterium]
MTAKIRHRLNGLEPDNLLAFLALLGLLRALQRDDDLPSVRASWSVDRPPARPVLHLTRPETETGLVDSVVRGLRGLAAQIDFDGRKDLRVTPAEGSVLLREARRSEAGDVWSALVSDAVISRDGTRLEPTPLCLMFGQGHQHFLDRVASIPRLKAPPDRGRGRAKKAISEEQAIAEALFDQWQRPDAAQSFRWDPREDVRYALRANDPTDARTKETTQHGANRLAAIALPLLTVAPQAPFGGRPRLAVRGGGRDASGRITFSWPIWRDPADLSCVCHLLDHPRLDDAKIRQALGIVEQRVATRVANGKFMNFTAGVAA